MTPPRRMICSWFTPLDAVMQVKIKAFTEQCNYYDLSNTQLQQSVQDKPLRSWLGTSGHLARALLLCWWQWACFIRELGSLMIVRFSSTKDLWAKAVHENIFRTGWQHLEWAWPTVVECLQVVISCTHFEFSSCWLECSQAQRQADKPLNPQSCLLAFRYSFATSMLMCQHFVPMLSCFCSERLHTQ